MKRKGIFLLTLFLFSGVLYAAALREASRAGRNGELILLHTNDFHGPLLENDGLAEIAAFVRSVRAVNPQVLLVDAGDFNTEGAFFNTGRIVIHGFNSMGYDAVTFGEYEFDGDQEQLDSQIALAEFPFVSSNITRSDGSFLGGNRYIVKNYDNFSVGIFGITTLRTRVIANPDSSLVFINELEAAWQVVEILRNIEKVDIVIGLTHMGDIQETDDHITSIELAKRIDGIDIIVDGHSHTLFQAPRMAGDAWVVSANELGKYVGYGKLTVRGGRLEDFSWTPVPIGPDTETSAMHILFLND